MTNIDDLKRLYKAAKTDEERERILDEITRQQVKDDRQIGSEAMSRLGLQEWE